MPISLFVCKNYYLKKSLLICLARQITHFNFCFYPRQTLFRWLLNICINIFFCKLCSGLLPTCILGLRGLLDWYLYVRYLLRALITLCYTCYNHFSRQSLMQWWEGTVNSLESRLSIKFRGSLARLLDLWPLPFCLHFLEVLQPGPRRSPYRISVPWKQGFSLKINWRWACGLYQLYDLPSFLLSQNSGRYTWNYCGIWNVGFPWRPVLKEDMHVFMYVG